MRRSLLGAASIAVFVIGIPAIAAEQSAATGEQTGQAATGERPAMPPGSPTATTRFPDVENVDPLQTRRELGAPEQAGGIGLMEADRVEDARVRNLQGEELGEIEKLILDLENGRIAFGIVEVGGFLGIGEKEIAVPWEAFRRGREADSFVLDMNRQQLEGAPSHDTQQLTELRGFEPLEPTYAYYGIEPYWKQQVSQAERPTEQAPQRRGGQQ